MATFSTDFDEYSTGDVATATSSAFTVQLAGGGDWTQTIVDLGAGDHAMRIARGTATQAVNNIVYNPLETAGDIDVVAAFTLNTTWDNNYFSGAVLLESDNEGYGIRFSVDSGPDAFRLGQFAANGINASSIGTYSALANPTAGTLIWTRVKRVGTTISGWVWTGTAGDMPADPLWSGTNSSLTTVKPGFHGQRTGDAPYTCIYFAVGTGADNAPMPGGSSIPIAAIASMNRRGAEWF
jgi:hypothetical protein